MRTSIFSGMGTALITPFKNGTDIDWASVEKLIEFQINNGVDYLVIAGTTGEGVTLDEDELFSLLKFCKEKSNGRVPIIAGAGSNNTRSLVKRIKKLNELKLSGYLVVTPYYNKPTQDGLLLHYSEVSKTAGDVPIILYNVPGRTGGWIMPETVAKLAQQHKNIIGIKEASGDPKFSMEMKKIVSAVAPDFTFLVGDDFLAMPLIVSGYNGVISVVSNEVPRQMKELVTASLKGDRKEAEKMHNTLLELMKINMIETNPGPVKYALKRMGYCDGSVRLPLVPMKDTSKMDAVLKLFT
ncbi:MAG: 4-hydroxy-tetrahydrodipicolinate synthase [Pseudomonadota bacterium]